MDQPFSVTILHNRSLTSVVSRPAPKRLSISTQTDALGVRVVYARPAALNMFIMSSNKASFFMRAFAPALKASSRALISGHTLSNDTAIQSITAAIIMAGNHEGAQGDRKGG